VVSTVHVPMTGRMIGPDVGEVLALLVADGAPQATARPDTPPLFTSASAVFVTETTQPIPKKNAHVKPKCGGV